METGPFKTGYGLRYGISKNKSSYSSIIMNYYTTFMVHSLPLWILLVFKSPELRIPLANMQGLRILPLEKIS